MGPYENGFQSALGEPMVVSLQCTGANKKPYAELIYALADDLLAIQGDDAFLVFFRPGKLEDAARSTGLGEGCGGSTVRCAKSLVCVAAPGTPGRPVEVCKPEKELLSSP